MVQNVQYLNGPPSHVTLPFEYLTPILSGIQMNLVFRCSVFRWLLWCIIQIFTVFNSLFAKSFQVLVEHGALVNAKSSNGMTPLHDAIRFLSQELVNIYDIAAVVVVVTFSRIIGGSVHRGSEK